MHNIRNGAQMEIAYLYKKYGKPHLRLGQFFVSRYIKNTWPELFYERDSKKATTIINKWLEDHQYTDSAPIAVYKLEEHTDEWKSNKDG